MMGKSMEQLSTELAMLQAESAELEAAREPGTDLVLANSPEAMQANMRDAAERLRRHHVLVKAKVAEVQAEAARQQAGLAAMADAAARALEPVKAAIREVEEQIKTIGLYLGTGEAITMLRDGERAPEDTRITVRQMVLRMDEEVAAAAESGGLDYRDMAKFDDWLLEDPAHLAQVLPEPKGLVCFTPRDPAKSKDDTRQMMGPNPDATMYWLIRNGDVLYRMTTDFQVSGKLVPGPQTLTSLFTDSHSGKPLRPGSRDWDRAQESAEATERTFFRVQVILQGLLHRTPVFEPLPMQGMDFMDEEHHEAGRLAFIMDAEASLGDGSYESFPAWRRRLAAQLRPGLRIVGDFNSYDGGFKSEYVKGDQWTRGYHSRTHPGNANAPENGTIYELERVQGGKKLGFKYERTEQVRLSNPVWVPSETRPGFGHYEHYGNPTIKASCTVELGDDWIIPYDLATEEELRSFLHRRTERQHYIGMFPVIKAALKAKREEREAEEPFRVMLAGVLARENGVTVAAAEADMDDLVTWFKLTNTYHRPLLPKVRTTGKGGEGVPEDKAQQMAAKAVRLITAEHARRVKIARTKPNMELVKQLREGLWQTSATRMLRTEAIMIGRRRADGKYIVVVPERSDENVYATVIVWGSRKGLDSMDHWQRISKRLASTWEVLWAHERWDAWEIDAAANRSLTDAEREQVMEEARKLIRAGEADVDADAPLLGFTIEPSYGYVELTAYLVKEEPVLPNPERLLTEPGTPGVVVKRSKGWKRREDGTVALAWGRYEGGFRGGGSEWSREWHERKPVSVGGDPWPSKAVVLWRDRPLIDRMRVQFQAYRHHAKAKDALGTQVSHLGLSLRRGWTAAWWENERQEFVAEFGKPELWTGQRKVLLDAIKRDRKDGPTAPSLGVLDGVLERFVEQGDGERLWGRYVADVVNEAIGLKWMEQEPEDDAKRVHPELMRLKFDRKAPPSDHWDRTDLGGEPEPEEELVDEGEAVEYDADGTFVVVAELNAGEPEDAEVIE